MKFEKHRLSNSSSFTQYLVVKELVELSFQLVAAVRGATNYITSHEFDVNEICKLFLKTSKKTRPGGFSNSLKPPSCTKEYQIEGSFLEVASF